MFKKNLKIPKVLIVLNPYISKVSQHVLATERERERERASENLKVKQFYYPLQHRVKIAKHKKFDGLHSNILGFWMLKNLKNFKI